MRKAIPVADPLDIPWLVFLPYNGTTVRISLHVSVNTVYYKIRNQEIRMRLAFNLVHCKGRNEKGFVEFLNFIPSSLSSSSSSSSSSPSAVFYFVYVVMRVKNHLVLFFSSKPIILKVQ